MRYRSGGLCIGWPQEARTRVRPQRIRLQQGRLLWGARLAHGLPLWLRLWPCGPSYGARGPVLRTGAAAGQYCQQEHAAKCVHQVHRVFKKLSSFGKAPANGSAGALPETPAQSPL